MAWTSYLVWFTFLRNHVIFFIEIEKQKKPFRKKPLGYLKFEEWGRGYLHTVFICSSCLHNTQFYFCILANFIAYYQSSYYKTKPSMSVEGI